MEEEARCRAGYQHAAEQAAKDLQGSDLDRGSGKTASNAQEPHATVQTGRRSCQSSSPWYAWYADASTRSRPPRWYPYASAWDVSSSSVVRTFPCSCLKSRPLTLYIYSMLGRPPVPGFGSPVPGMAFPPPGAAARPAAPALPPYTAPSSRLELKTGQVMVYGDNDVSVEEKRAKNPKYASLVAAAAPIAAAPAPVAPAPAVAAPQTVPAASAAPSAEESAQVAAGQKRARAADFI